MKSLSANSIRAFHFVSSIIWVKSTKSSAEITIPRWLKFNTVKICQHDNVKYPI
jgi:TusA-related sulfurtransferase